MSNKDSNSSVGSSAGLAVIVVFGSFAAFIVSPGVLVIHSLSKIFGLFPDRGQIWAFGAVVSCSVYAMLRAFTHDSVKNYFMVCFAVVSITAVSHFGFHMSWPSEILKCMFW